ncbi:predicted protein [Naegleria gruberi]|uniref:Predicted protein n=1 Tax=Naegleria gruberi TaxID=5762 RepID=D2VL42_NAEGR|nr:uncharacterized protein NAEGRDRAFT_69654 [Naegleria gruberi]EFC42474.1 predicted protein [Naegleria gruberi]|eukprot:XP_002675218.1 predicted protein [Naegleria gruberi strain NEG-M]
MSSKELKKLLKGLPKLKTPSKKLPFASSSNNKFNLSESSKTKATVGHIRVSDKLKDCIFDSIKIRNLTRDILKFTPHKDYGVTVLFCGNKYITSLNEKDRKKKGPTDILSYPVYSPDLDHNFALMEKDAAFNDDLAKLLADEHKILMEEEKFLGDMVISQPYIVDYCKENNISLDHHMALLLTHGILHLMGYDHETDSDYAIMKEKEDEILSGLEKKYGKEEWSKLKVTKS